MAPHDAPKKSDYLRVLETADEFPIPPKQDFADHQFLPAPDLKVIGDMLIDKYDDFAHLHNLNANIVFLWKERGGEGGGRAVLGKCVKPSGLTDYFACAAETAGRSRDRGIRALENRHQANRRSLRDGKGRSARFVYERCVGA